jgi:hypothetical protein
MRKAIVGTVTGIALFAGGMAYAGGPTAASVSSVAGTIHESDMADEGGTYVYNAYCPTGTYVITAVQTGTQDGNFSISTGDGSPGLSTFAQIINWQADSSAYSYEVICITIP